MHKKLSKKSHPALLAFCRDSEGYNLEHAF